MSERIEHSTAEQLVNSLGKGQPHDVEVLALLQKYLDNRDYFVMTEDTASLIEKALADFS
jgi:predicted RecB family endonuclease